MDLFSQDKGVSDFAPLAHRLRPKNLEEFLGQEHIFGKKQGLKEMILGGYIPNLILWGPPGVGKTTFAELLSNYTKAHFISLNAISYGAKDLKEVGERAKRDLEVQNQKSLVFVDEVHRFNKSQQDVLLPYVEKGYFTFVGATTENPSFQLNRALLSRCRLLVFERLEEKALAQILAKVLRLWELSEKEVFLDLDAKNYFFSLADGDARNFLNNLEYLEEYKKNTTDEHKVFSKDKLKEIFHNELLSYDRNESHYDTISAFIKSIRGSDPDAAVYYLARMIDGGEDPLFIARRLLIAASEDIGNADPKAINIALAGFQAIERLGLPEGAITLAQVSTYLASAPKSNRSYKALKIAQEEVRKSGSLSIPMHLRNAPTSIMKDLGYAKGYQYAHDYEGAKIKQEHLPKELKNKKFYQPSDHGYEKHISAYLEWLKKN